MPTLMEHPTVIKFQERKRSVGDQLSVLNAESLRRLCMEQGSDDVGFVEIDRKGLTGQRDDIIDLFPSAKSLLCVAIKVNRNNVRAPARSISSTEFHEGSNRIKDVSRKITSALERKGVSAIGVSGWFPFEMDGWPLKISIVSMKPLAIEAGLGHMGNNRLVIHPRFGAFILLCAIVIDREIDSYDSPIDYKPCLDCKLCSAVCPTGAIAPDGYFNFALCATHNYREKLGGFSDWVENIVQSKSTEDYRHRVSDSETISMWQSLGYGPNTKCDYCMAVCPAGDDVIAPFITDRKRYLNDIVKPLQSKEEKVYVVKESDAEAHVSRRFPHKAIRRVGNGLRPGSVEGFLAVLPLIFNRNQSEGLDAKYHFTFTGEEKAEATVVIRDKTITVEKGHIGKPDIRITADSRTWIGFLEKEKSLVWALLRRKIKIKGSPALLQAFGKCFPS